MVALLSCPPCLAPVLCALSLTGPATSASAEVWVVRQNGPANFQTIQAAVDAASDGDVILVRSGSYDGFTVAQKGLRIQFDGSTAVGSPVEITGVPSGSLMTLSGMKVTLSYPDAAALTIRNSQGDVRVQDSVLHGSPGHKIDMYSADPATSGAVVKICASVVLTGCNLTGGEGLAYGELWGFAPWGADALEVQSARVALYDCDLLGGDGENSWEAVGGGGGEGCRPAGTYEFFAGGTRIQGGHGGDGQDAGDCYDWPYPGGDGGHGLFAGLAPIDLFDWICVGGSGGAGGEDCYGFPEADGADGYGIHIGGGQTLTQHAGQFRRMVLTSSSCAGSMSPVDVYGLPGDRVSLVVDDETDWVLDASVRGVWVPKDTSWQLPLGVIPASGVLNTQVALTAPGPSPDVFVQLLTTTTNGQQYLGTPQHVLLFDSGVQNYCQTADNSAGTGGALISATGSTSLSTNDLTLSVTGGPTLQPGLFLYGRLPQNVPFGDGYLCLAGPLIRVSPALTSDAGGGWSRTLDFDSPPFSIPYGWIAPGSSRNFQLWYRDPAGPGGTGFNLSDAVEIHFCP